MMILCWPLNSSICDRLSFTPTKGCWIRQSSFIAMAIIIDWISTVLDSYPALLMSSPVITAKSTERVISLWQDFIVKLKMRYLFVELGQISTVDDGRFWKNKGSTFNLKLRSCHGNGVRVCCIKLWIDTGCRKLVLLFSRSSARALFAMRSH